MNNINTTNYNFSNYLHEYIDTHKIDIYSYSVSSVKEFADETFQFLVNNFSDDNTKLILCANFLYLSSLRMVIEKNNLSQKLINRFEKLEKELFEIQLDIERSLLENFSKF